MTNSWNAVDLGDGGQLGVSLWGGVAASVAAEAEVNTGIGNDMDASGEFSGDVDMRDTEGGELPLMGTFIKSELEEDIPVQTVEMIDDVQAARSSTEELPSIQTLIKSEPEADIPVRTVETVHDVHLASSSTNSSSPFNLDSFWGGVQAAAATTPTTPSNSGSWTFRLGDTDTSNSSSENYPDNVAQFVVNTPCPPRTLHVEHRTGALSEHFRKKKRTEIPTVQQHAWLKSNLDLGESGKRRSPPPKKSENLLSLENLRSIERPSRHEWTGEQRKLLCALYRWYDATGEEVTRIFNSIAGVNLRKTAIQAQIGELRFYGGLAYLDFGEVFQAVPFHDPTGRFSSLRKTIEQEALNLGINLPFRETEWNPPTGKAAYAESDFVRARYKSLVERTQQASILKEATSRISSYATLAIPLGGYAIVTGDAWDEAETFVDAEPADPPSSSNVSLPSQRSCNKPEHIAFRVWDASSRTRFTDAGFVAELFSDWNGAFPNPIPMNDAHDAFMILANAHMSVVGNASAFVSVTTSLLQAMVYASTMESPHIAIIDLDVLDEPYKMTYAYDVLKWLKSNGQAQWARYKGVAEHLIWANIPNEAIIHHFDLSDLCSENAPENLFSILLSLDLFQPTTDLTNGEIPSKRRPTRVVSKLLANRELTLTTATAKTMGRLAAKFGLNKTTVTLMHIEEFIMVVCDGWSIRDAPLHDIHAMSSLANQFAAVLNCHYSIQAVMAAFIDGVQKGAKNIEHFSGGRRRGSKRTKTV